MPALSAFVAAVCVLASLRRLAVAVAPASLDADALRQALANVGTIRRLGASLGAASEVHWARGLFQAFGEPDPRLRAALVGEQLTELERLATRWLRVPRICASIATSSGFLFASVALLRTWAAVQTLPIGAALAPAVDAFACGVMAAAFCIVIHARAGQAARKSLAAIHRLVDRMQTMSDAAEEAELGIQ